MSGEPCCAAIRRRVTPGWSLGSLAAGGTPYICSEAYLLAVHKGCVWDPTSSSCQKSLWFILHVIWRKSQPSSLLCAACISNNTRPPSVLGSSVTKDRRWTDNSSSKASLSIIGNNHCSLSNFLEAQVPSTKYTKMLPSCSDSTRFPLHIKSFFWKWEELPI